MHTAPLLYELPPPFPFWKADYISILLLQASKGRFKQDKPVLHNFPMLGDQLSLSRIVWDYKTTDSSDGNVNMYTDSVIGHNAHSLAKNHRLMAKST